MFFFSLFFLDISTQQQQQEQHDNTAWYPVVGASNINEVDEPNQQGLAKPKNNAATTITTTTTTTTATNKQIFSLTIVATILMKFC